MIGSRQPIVTTLGDDVVLPCHLEPSINAEGLTVEWSRPELMPDPSDRLSRVEYVMVYRDRHEVLDMKIQSYLRRTALFEEELKHGNISLKIVNVTLADEGRYRCYIPKLDSRRKDWIVQLIVGETQVNFRSCDLFNCFFLILCRKSSQIFCAFLEPEKTTDLPPHPGNLQTADPKTETTVKGERER